VDASLAPFHSRGDGTARENLDDWLVQPLDPRIAQNDQALIRSLYGIEEE
jgi:hypothetical protein